jgi:dihydropteroate synthase
MGSAIATIVMETPEGGGPLRPSGPGYAGRMEGLIWRAGPHDLDCSAGTLVMGVLNVTPDSFSDGGRFLDHESAVTHGLEMARDGADIIDVGGESTRPGSDPVTTDDELARVAPVVKRLAAETDGPISIDTRRADVARAAIEAGAAIVNDVSAGRDPAMFDTVRETGAGLVLMHMHGQPKTMQQEPLDRDVVGIVRDELASRVAAAEAEGIARDRLAIDPGLGFGKTSEGSLRLMRHIDAFLDLRLPVVVGPSRKSFIGKALGDLPVDQRLEGTAGAVAYLASRGAHVVRVHDVPEMVRVVRMVGAIARA